MKVEERLYVPPFRQITEPGTDAEFAPERVVGLLAVEPFPPPEGETKIVQLVASWANPQLGKSDKQKIVKIDFLRSNIKSPHFYYSDITVPFHDRAFP
jgi:hypothetical protein